MNKTLLKICGLLVLIMAANGCKSQVPYPTTYDFSTQHKMQAAYHWRILANDVAQQIDEQLAVNISSVYVERNNDFIPFENLFYDMLVEELTLLGIAVYDEQMIESPTIKYKARVLEHSDRYIRHPPGLFTALTGGVWVARELALYGSIEGLAFSTLGAAAAVDVLDGYSTGSLSKKEVIVNVSVLDRGAYVFSSNNIYYINENDYWHYDPDPFVRKSGANIARHTIGVEQEDQAVATEQRNSSTIKFKGE